MDFHQSAPESRVSGKVGNPVPGIGRGHGDLEFLVFIRLLQLRIEPPFAHKIEAVDKECAMGDVSPMLVHILEHLFMKKHPRRGKRLLKAVPVLLLLGHETQEVVLDRLTELVLDAHIDLVILVKVLGRCASLFKA